MTITLITNPGTNRINHTLQLQIPIHKRHVTLANPANVSTSRAYYSITTFPMRQFIMDSMKAKLYFIAEQPDIGSEATRHERLKPQRVATKINFADPDGETTFGRGRVGVSDVVETG